MLGDLRCQVSELVDSPSCVGALRTYEVIRQQKRGRRAEGYVLAPIASDVRTFVFGLLRLGQKLQVLARDVVHPHAVEKVLNVGPGHRRECFASRRQKFDGTAQRACRITFEVGLDSGKFQYRLERRPIYSSHALR